MQSDQLRTTEELWTKENLLNLGMARTATAGAQCIERALHELQEALQSRHLTDYVESRIRRAIMLLRGEAVP